MPAKENEIRLDPLLETQQNQLGIVVGIGEGIDNKAMALLAATVAIMIFIGQADLSVTHWWQYVLLLGPYILSLITTALALQPKEYLGASIDLHQHPEYLSLKGEALILQLLADTQEAITHNQRVNDTHWRLCLISAGFIIVGAIALFGIL